MAISAKVRYEVLRRDRYTCRFCGSSAPDVVLHIDHVEPRIGGGGDQPANLQVLCEECNLGKSMTLPEKWLVKDAAGRERAWQRSGGRHPEAKDDDLTSMYAYMDAYSELDSLPSSQVLACVAHVMAEVYPYRPDGPELIVAAAKLARTGYGATSPGVPV